MRKHRTLWGQIYTAGSIVMELQGREGREARSRIFLILGRHLTGSGFSLTGPQPFWSMVLFVATIQAGLGLHFAVAAKHSSAHEHYFFFFAFYPTETEVVEVEAEVGAR